MKSEMIKFAGGLMTESGPMNRPPGSCLIATNYEIPPTGGYRRINGYTLYDGSAAPAVPAALPGSGPVRGVVVFNDVVYAVRDNVAATAGVMYKATSSGWVDVGASLPAGGQYEFIVYNFYGASNLKKLYGVNGVGPAFSFDGTTFSSIPVTGMTVDKPTHISAFRNHLFVSFPGGSVQHSSITDPTTWSAILGAGELGVGDEVTGFTVEAGGTLVIFSRDRINLLTGSSSADWTLTCFSEDSGAVEGSVQRFGTSLFLDDRGLRSLETSQKFGDFSAGTLSAGFRPVVDELVAVGVSCSVTVKSKNQYRLFFANGQGLCCSFAGDRFVGATRIDYPVEISSVCSGEIFARERCFFGSDEGSVFETDDGNSFSGVEIVSLLRTQFYHYRSPTDKKRFRRIFFETDADDATQFLLAASFGYGSGDIPRSVGMYGAGGFWNGSYWDGFNWSVPTAPTGPVRLAGVGNNMSVLISHSSATDACFTLFGMVCEFDKRGHIR